MVSSIYINCFLEKVGRVREDSGRIRIQLRNKSYRIIDTLSQPNQVLFTDDLATLAKNANEFTQGDG